MYLDDMRHAKLVDVEFHAELDDHSLLPPNEARNNRYYLSLTYHAENIAGVWEIKFPRIMLPFCTFNLPVIISDYTGSAQIDLGFAKLPLDVDDENQYALAKLVEPKIHELTLPEIEKRLGYKIRIVEEGTK